MKLGPAQAAVLVVVAGAALADPKGKLSPTGEKAAALHEAAKLLDTADSALASGNKNFAEQMFSTAELLVGPEALASIAPLYRQGAPPRVQTPTQKIDTAAPPQPKTVGNSEQDDVEAKVPPPPQFGSLNGTLQIEGKPLAGAFGLVTLEPANGKFKPRQAKHRVIEQRNREFSPHVMAIPVGSTIAFPNFDTVFHNVFSTSPLAAFDLGIYKAGEAREYTFQKEGIIRLGCNLHANMSAYIVVVSEPFFVATDDAGHFAFRHIPPGKYKLKAWSERSKAPIVKEISISVGKNETKVGVAGDAPGEPCKDDQHKGQWCAANAPDKFGAKR